EKLPVARWLRRWSGKGTFEKIWLPLLRAKLGEAYKTTSAAFIWAHINRMYKARRTGLKREMFGYVPGGYGRVLDRFAEVLEEQGVEIVCNAPVAEARSTPEGTVAVKLSSAQSREFDKVVFTIPSPYISQACPQLSSEEHKRLGSIEYL